MSIARKPSTPLIATQQTPPPAQKAGSVHFRRKSGFYSGRHFVLLPPRYHGSVEAMFAQFRPTCGHHCCLISVLDVPTTMVAQKPSWVTSGVIAVILSHFRLQWRHHDGHIGQFPVLNQHLFPHLQQANCLQYQTITRG